MKIVPNEFWIAAATMLGAIFGSFVNMAAYRLPRGISTWKRSRSFCPKCEHQLSWSDNIPILSYTFLRGKCRYCGAPIPRRYLFTELIIATLFGMCAYQYFSLNGGWEGPMPAVWFGLEMFLIVDLMTLSVVDLEVWLIPIETTIVWIPVAVILSMIFPDALHPARTPWTNTPWLDGLIDSFSGLAIAGGFLWSMNPIVALLVMLRYRIRGINDAPPEAMGIGDVHMLGMFGAFVGWKPALMAILFGVVIGATVGISKILWNKFQRRRLGDKWKPPPQPSFDLGDEGKPPEPMLWTLPVFGVIVMFVVFMLNGRFAYIPRVSIDFLAPFYLLAGIGLILLISTPFYYYLKSKNRLPGGNVVENEEGKKEEVYQGNYIPFGPSLAAGCLIVAFWEPLLRAFGGWFFGGITTPIGATVPAPTTWDYHVVGEAALAAGIAGFLLKFNAAAQWVSNALGFGPPK